MGAIIEATALSTDPELRSSVVHAGHAGRAAIAAAGLTPRDVDLLINVGVFRDRNMCEPGLAAMIQKLVGMNLDYVESRQAATSFDLMNSACGALNAVQVASAFLATGSARRVLVVSSDAHPSNQRVAGFPYTTMGAALLLRHGDDATRGFGPVQIAAAPDGAPGIRAHVPRVDACDQAVIVDRHPELGARALALATPLARSYLERERLDPRGTLLISTHPTPTFARELGQALGIDAVVEPTGLDGNPHSSALTWGYHTAQARGRAARQVLFVAVGAGMSAACAVYRP